VAEAQSELTQFSKDDPGQSSSNSQARQGRPPAVGGSGGASPLRIKQEDERNPEGVSAEASTLSGLSTVRCRAGDPTPSGSQQKQVLLLRDSCESLASVSRPGHLADLSICL